MQGGAPKKIFFDGNALSGSIHSTYQLPSLQTDQNPTLGQPIMHLPDARVCRIIYYYYKMQG